VHLLEVLLLAAQHAHLQLDLLDARLERGLLARPRSRRQSSLAPSLAAPAAPAAPATIASR